jgi:glycosyltransferase involved in cell wall biosynthesis
MRILVVAYYYPPDSAVGAIRPAKIVRALAARGHDVQVIAAGGAGGTSTSSAEHVHRVRPMRNPRELYTSLRKPERKAAVEAAASASSGEGEVPTSVPAWRRQIFSLLWLPDDRQGFILPAYRAARALAAEKPFDLIYTSAPPASVHLVGLLFSKATGVRWIAEFRDPWLDGVPKPYHVRSAFSDAADRRLERACLNGASEVVTVTYTAAEKIDAKRRALSRPPTRVVLNGIDEISPRASRDDSSPIRAVHVGSLYGSRDPRPLIEAIAELRRRGELHKRGVIMEFIGDARWYAGTSLEEFAKDAGIADVLRLRDTVPHAEVAKILDDADLLVLLAQQQPVQVPNKLYEYLGQRKPILAFADEQGETAAMLRRAGQHFVVTERDMAATTRIVGDAFNAAASSDWSPNDDQLQVWRTDRQMATLVSLVEA